MEMQIYGVRGLGSLDLYILILNDGALQSGHRGLSLRYSVCSKMALFDVKMKTANIHHITSGAGDIQCHGRGVLEFYMGRGMPGWGHHVYLKRAYIGN